jgi:hypothetical protein
VAVATHYGGQSCARPAVETTTDSAGGFRLPATGRQHRFLVLMSFDRVPIPYSFCAGVTDTLGLVYRGDRSWWSGEADAIACIQSETPAGLRVLCYGYYEWDGEHRLRVDSVDAERAR